MKSDISKTDTRILSFTEGQPVFVRLDYGIWWPAYVSDVKNGVTVKFWDEENEWVFYIVYTGKITGKCHIDIDNYFE